MSASLLLILSIIITREFSLSLNTNTTEYGYDINVKLYGNKNSTSEPCGDSLLSSAEKVLIPENTSIRILSTNETREYFQYLNICSEPYIPENASKEIVEKTVPSSNYKCWYYSSDNFSILLNGSVVLFGEVLEKATYELEGDKLKHCVRNRFMTNSLLRKILLIMEKVACGISIIALLSHLLVFAFVPTMRNLAGYNLASLSLAFLMANCFYLIGELLNSLDIPCIASTSLEHFFFLAAFFWMNIMAFDIWRTIRRAIQKLIAPDGNVKVLRFLCYCVYAWGLTLMISVTAAICDSSPEVPDEFKPFFGVDGNCWFNNEKAKHIYFSIPISVLLSLNVIFFIMSAVLIMRNTMKDSLEKKTAKNNFLVCVRIELIIGVTWLIAVLLSVVKREGLWEDMSIILDILNSLQGLFIFLLFSCSNKNWKSFKRKPKNTSEASSRSTEIETCTTKM